MCFAYTYISISESWVNVKGAPQKNYIAQKGEGGVIHTMSIYSSSQRCSVKKMQKQLNYPDNCLLH